MLLIPFMLDKIVHEFGICYGTTKQVYQLYGQRAEFSWRNGKNNVQDAW